MAIITTPVEAIEIEDLSLTQQKTIRNYLGIADNPYQPEKTYIIFDAAVGDNDLHIDTGASSSYSIYKGDGSLKTDYTDTGGTKVLNYAVAGRYLITIDGTFNGINTGVAAAAAKNKYIALISGSNYPTTIVDSAFIDCLYFEYLFSKYVETIEQYAFDGCISLRNVDMPEVLTIGNNAFSQNSQLENVSFPSATTIGNYSFQLCTKLKIISFKSVTTAGEGAFKTCSSLNVANMYGITSLGLQCFYQCGSLSSFISATLSSIPEQCFYGCFNLEFISCRAATSIGEGAFYNCQSIYKISVGAITSVGTNAFYNCYELRIFIMDYYASVTYGTTPFVNVYLSDLLVSETNSTGANEIKSEFTSAGCQYLTGSRLLY